MKISMDKCYQTMCGRPVRILCVDGPRPDYPVVGYIDSDETVHHWTADGMSVHEDITSPRNLVEVTPYSTFKEGDPVMVRAASNAPWRRRYFAYEGNGVAYAFVDGATKWTSIGRAIPWSECRRPTHKELEEVEG